MNEEICFSSATELVDKLQTGELSPVTVIDAYLDRIEANNPEINAYVTVLAEDARRKAREAEKRLEDNESTGPLTGVPIAIKDFLGFKKGVRHTFGSRAFKDFTPDRDAIFVRRLEEAGAIVLGKTNTPEFTRKGTTTNPEYGDTANPFDQTKTPSGSSGGSAAAVADGMAALAQGSDVAGSIRAPASACGVFGFKPSPGRVPYSFGPNAFLGNKPYMEIGPLTRTVEDAALMLDVIAGSHPRDPRSIPDDDIDYLAAVERSSDHMTVAYSDDFGLYPVDERVRSVFHEAMGSLESVFSAVTTRDPDLDDDLETIHESFLIMLSGVSAEIDRCFHDEYGVDVLGEDRDLITEYVVERSEMAQDLSALEFTHADAMRTTVFDAFQDIFEDHDLFMVPTLSVPPFDIDIPGPTEVDGEPINKYHGWMMTWLFNMTGHPVASIPIGTTSDGLPIGAQIVGRKYADEDVLSASSAIEDVLPWADTYPPGQS